MNRILNGPCRRMCLFDPFDQPFGVNDAIMDTAVVWFGEVWAAFGRMSQGLPVTMAAEDGFGATPTVSLTG